VQEEKCRGAERNCQNRKLECINTHKICPNSQKAKMTPMDLAQASRISLEQDSASYE